jgi:putative SOS response-associated peptidase YedK
MRWGLVPRWWSKPLKELRAATFNARAETVETKPFFRDAFRRNTCHRYSSRFGMSGIMAGCGAPRQH